MNYTVDYKEARAGRDNHYGKPLVDTHSRTTYLNDSIFYIRLATIAVTMKGLRKIVIACNKSFWNVALHSHADGDLSALILIMAMFLPILHMAALPSHNLSGMTVHLHTIMHHLHPP